MNRYILLILITLSLAAGSCSGRKTKTERKNLIPEKELVSILTDIHLADGLLTIPAVNHVYYGLDTLAPYNSIIEGYGYNREQMDKTMRFYFIKRQKKLIKIYDKVLNSISELEARITEEEPGADANQLNLWTGSRYYSFPDMKTGQKARTDIPLPPAGTYFLTFTLTLFPDDQSADPHIGLYFMSYDEAGNEKRDYFETIPFLKDGIPHNYIVRLVVNSKNSARLKGWFIDNECQPDNAYMHYMIDNITLLRKLPE